MNLRNKSRPKIKVEIYSKSDCHLCDIAKTILLKAQKKFLYELIETDITCDRDLFARYKEEIPVVFINGRKAFKFKIDEDELRRKLKRLK